MARAPNAGGPERIGRYEVLLRIANGGMAAVYLARSRGVGGFERDVAIKLTHPHLSREFAADLIEEAKLAVRIRHPNVVPIVDVGDDPQGVFLVMEYVEGDSLSGLHRRALEAREPMPLGIGMRILIDALSGLHAAHELKDENGESLGIVHRDFTPQNILVGTDGVARLADFGIARAADRAGGQTRAGTVKGKISYMAPEQARSQTLDRRCDVWAAGIVAWELLARRRMHEKVENELSMLLKIVSEEPPRLRTVVPDVPPEFEAAVAAALKIDVQQRTPSAARLARALVSACRQHGQLAEIDEVAAYVQRVVGPKLARRRSRIAESATIRLASVSGDGDARIEIPSDLSSELIIDVEDTGEESLDSVDVIAPLTPSMVAQFSSAGPSARPETPTKTDTTSAAASLAPPPRKTGALRAFAFASAGLLVIAGAGIAWRVSSGGAQAEANAAERARVLQSSAAAQPTVVATDMPSASAATAIQPPLVVHVHANERVSTLRMGSRAVRLAAPTLDPMIDVADDERGRALTLHGATADGRQAMVVVPAGATAATLVFPMIRTNMPRPAGGNAKPPPLAGSPY